MRVITGKARGVQLKTPEGMQTRPTADRVKELETELILQYLSGEVDDNGTPLLYLGVD